MNIVTHPPRRIKSTAQAHFGVDGESWIGGAHKELYASWTCQTLKMPPRERKFPGGRTVSLVEALGVGRKKLPPGGLTKDPTQRYTVIMALVSCPEELGPCGVWGFSREGVADEVQ